MDINLLNLWILDMDGKFKRVRGLLSGSEV
jgi:hypothetical protein